MSLEQLRQIIAQQPRVRLGEWPTPLVKLDRLSQQLGVELFMKRDELSGIALGGNKTRKMEFVLADAMAKGYRDVLTEGPRTSNHTMMTAMACLRLGLRCHCVVASEPPDFYEGNILLLRYMGVSLTFSPLDIANPDPADVVRFNAAVERARAETGAYPIPAGGTMPVAEFGYMNAVLEMAEQRGGDLPFDALFVAYGTGGTSTGIVLGQAVAGFRVPVYAVAVGTRQAFEALRDRDLAGLYEHMVTELRLDIRHVRPAVEEVFGYAETGYAVPTAGGDAAMKLLASTEGYFLDPVYTAKAFDAMLDMISTGKIAPGSRVLFMHTGGLSMLPVGHYAWPETVSNG